MPYRNADIAKHKKCYSLYTKMPNKVSLSSSILSQIGYEPRYFFVPFCTFLYLFVPFCTFLYLFVPFCTFSYLFVSFCTFLYILYLFVPIRIFFVLFLQSAQCRTAFILTDFSWNFGKFVTINAL